MMTGPKKDDVINTQPPLEGTNSLISQLAQVEFWYFAGRLVGGISAVAGFGWLGQKIREYVLFSIEYVKAFR